MKNSDTSKIRIVLRISGQKTTDELIAESELVETVNIKGAEVGIYRVQISFSGSIREEQIYTNNIELLEEHIALELKNVLNELNPATDHVEVIHDSYELLKFQAGYCQHCGKKLLESYGAVVGILKRCPGCRKISFIRHNPQ